MSRFCISADGASCECAVVVGDEWQAKGLGHLLMRLLIDVARRRGIKHMFSVDSAGNRQMSDLAASLGFRRKANHDCPSEVIYNLDLSGDVRYRTYNGPHFTQYLSTSREFGDYVVLGVCGDAAWTRDQ